MSESPEDVTPIASPESPSETEDTTNNTNERPAFLDEQSPQTFPDAHSQRRTRPDRKTSSPASRPQPIAPSQNSPGASRQVPGGARRTSTRSPMQRTGSRITTTFGTQVCSVPKHPRPPEPFVFHVANTPTPKKSPPADDSMDLSPSSSGKKRGRSSYKCQKCGQPKRGHICPSISTPIIDSSSSSHQPNPFEQLQLQILNSLTGHINNPYNSLPHQNMTHLSTSNSINGNGQNTTTNNNNNNNNNNNGPTLDGTGMASSDSFWTQNGPLSHGSNTFYDDPSGQIGRMMGSSSFFNNSIYGPMFASYMQRGLSSLYDQTPLIEVTPASSSSSSSATTIPVSSLQASFPISPEPPSDKDRASFGSASTTVDGLDEHKHTEDHMGDGSDYGVGGATPGGGGGGGSQPGMLCRSASFYSPWFDMTISSVESLRTSIASPLGVQWDKRRRVIFKLDRFKQRLIEWKHSLQNEMINGPSASSSSSQSSSSQPSNPNSNSQSQSQSQFQSNPRSYSTSSSATLTPSPSVSSGITADYNPSQDAPRSPTL